MAVHSGSIDPHQLTCEHRKRHDGVVNSAGLGRGVRVLGAHDDPCVCHFVLVKPDEVASIQRQHGAPGPRREVEDFMIGDRLPCITASFVVSTSWPSARSASTVRRGKFSFA